MDFSLIPRDIIGDVQSAPQTFSSWNKCMSKAYCKWPAIVGIIIGSLILLSLLFCLIQCLCCGVSCAKMLCCCCRGCGHTGSREKSPRHRGDYSQMPPTPYQGYHAQPSPAQMAWAQRTPQTATFDAGKKINEDSLPAMPSWDTAKTHRVEDNSIPDPQHMNDVEMGHMRPQETGLTNRNGYNQVPTGPISPLSPSRSQPYFSQPPSQPYSSDLGAQRLGHNGGYDEFEQAPLSPAPTYHTNPTHVATDRFMAGAASPTPYGYQSGPPPPHTRSYAPSSNMSTRYDQTDYNSSYHHASLSPQPTMGGRPPSFGNSYEHTYDGDYVDQRGQRPPSLLQIGRKAVPGSQREV